MKHTVPTQHTAGRVQEWLRIYDPMDATKVYNVDKTFLTSSYSCLWGNGCKGVGPASMEADHNNGCCTHGVYFRDENDLANTTAMVDLLTPDDWEMHGQPWMVDRRNGKDDFSDSEMFPVKTRVVNGACIFSNRGEKGFGCAFHKAALRLGRNYTETKPHVCSEVPVSITREESDNGITEVIVTLRTLEDWGDTEDQRYWCADDPAAYEGGQMAYYSLANELRYLLGDRVYELIGVALDAQTGMPAAYNFLPIVEVS